MEDKVLLKRTVDIVVSSILLLIFSPVLCITAVLIRLFIGSPILFMQERPGRGMKPFRIYKFRTMLNLRDGQGELLSDELRQSPFGNRIRKLSIDELPQLLNVLRGEMSLIGPRPLLMKYLPYYTQREQLRFAVRPGITGIAQVSGRNCLEWNTRLELDAQYVENWSVWLDFRIVYKTVVNVLRRDGIVDVPGLNEPDLDHYRLGIKEYPAYAMNGTREYNL